jgi:aryl sulfotransferase
MDITDRPFKKRSFVNRFFDPTVWDDFNYRKDDIVIASYAKAGTTLAQQIVAQLMFNTGEDVDVAAISPWIDSVYPDKRTKLDLLQAQSHRRFFKTHLPVDALAFSDDAKYIYLARDGRDIALSLFDHQNATRPDAQLLSSESAAASGKLRVLAPAQLPIGDFFDAWLDKDGHPFWPFWDNLRSWWQARTLPNVLFVHYADLVSNMSAEIERIAAFLDLPLSADRLPSILSNCSFDSMRANARLYVPHGSGLWKDEGKAFFNKGQNGRWTDVLSPQARASFEQRALDELGPACAGWMISGGLAENFAD